MSLGVWSRMRAAYIAARRAWSDPTTAFSEETSNLQTARQAIYLERLMYAELAAYDDLAMWAGRLTDSRLYTFTRGIYNPVGRLCEFYESMVWPGTIPQGPGSLPPGARNALPFASLSTEGLEDALLQVCQWGNLQTTLPMIAYYAAAVGDCGLEIVDDMERQKVAPKVWWPGFVTNLVLDDYGNTKRVKLEFRTRDSMGEKGYTYGIEYTTETISTFKDGQPASYDGVDAERDNPYGFVPFVWFRHGLQFGPFGKPAFRAWTKLDNLNSKVSRTLDYITTKEKSPIGIASDWDGRGLGDIDIKAQRTETLDTAEYGTPDTNVIGGQDGDDVFILSLPPDASKVDLSGDIDPAATLEWIRETLKELEADYPENAAFSKLREMTQASGIAIGRAVRDAQAKLDKVQQSHDQQLVKALQMAVAIAGWRVSEAPERWTAGGAAREKFRPFGLKSYEAGDLDFALALRPIEPISDVEEAQGRATKYGAISAGKSAGLPDRMVYLEAGYSEAEVDEIEKHGEEAEEKALKRALELRRKAIDDEQRKTLPPGTTPPEPGFEDAIDADVA